MRHGATFQSKSPQNDGKWPETCLELIFERFHTKSNKKFLNFFQKFSKFFKIMSLKVGTKRLQMARFVLLKGFYKVDFGRHTLSNYCSNRIPFISNGEHILLCNSGTEGRRDSGVGGVRPNSGALNTPVLDPSLYDLPFPRYSHFKISK